MKKRINTFVRDQARNGTYEILPPSQAIFERMSGIQEAALSTMVSRAMLDYEQPPMDLARLALDYVPSRLEKEAGHFASINRDLFDVVVKDFAAIPLQGENGLKKRTELGEWLYDPI